MVYLSVQTHPYMHVYPYRCRDKYDFDSLLRLSVYCKRKVVCVCVCVCTCVCIYVCACMHVSVRERPSELFFAP